MCRYALYYYTGTARVFIGLRVCVCIRAHVNTITVIRIIIITIMLFVLLCIVTYCYAKRSNGKTRVFRSCLHDYTA